MASWIDPTRKAIRIAASTFRPSGTIAIALSNAIEMALVGPLISWREESKTAPTAVITIAV